MFHIRFTCFTYVEIKHTYNVLNISTMRLFSTNVKHEFKNHILNMCFNTYIHTPVTYSTFMYVMHPSFRCGFHNLCYMRFIGYIGISGTPLLAEFLYINMKQILFKHQYVKKLKHSLLPITHHSGISMKYNQSTILTYINVYSIYTSELELKGTTKSASSLAFLDMLLEKDIDVNLTKVMTSFYL